MTESKGYRFNPNKAARASPLAKATIFTGLLLFFSSIWWFLPMLLYWTSDKPRFIVGLGVLLVGTATTFGVLYAVNKLAEKHLWTKHE